MGKKQKLTATAFFLVLRLAVGGLFIGAGGLKLWDPTQFLNAIESFQLLPFRLAYFTALFLPWLEVWAGLAVIFKKAYMGGLTLLSAFMVLFIVVLMISWGRGLDVTCGCFGNLFSENASYPKLLLRNLLILAGLIGLMMARSRSSEDIPTPAQGGLSQDF